jgi:hypothetical protein
MNEIKLYWNDEITILDKFYILMNIIIKNYSTTFFDFYLISIINALQIILIYTKEQIGVFDDKDISDRILINISNIVRYTELIKHNIIAIDAVCGYSGGVNKDDALRDFIKAYVGFNLINFDDKDVSKLEKTISTGNWGCGAFGGDYELKFIQQLLAATYAGVDKLYYYTFSREEMNNVVKNLEKIKSLNANDLYERMVGAELKKGKVLDIILNMDINNNVNNTQENKEKSCFDKLCKIN